MAEIHRSGRIRPMLRFRRVIAAPVLLLLLTVIVYWKLVCTDEYTWLEGPDLAYQVLPWWQFEAGEWAHGRFPIWDPYLWNGQPLIGQAQPGVAYPLNWLLFLMPLKRGWLQQGYLHWYYVVVHFLAALFCYFFCRDQRLSKPASIAGGCAFAFGGFVMGNDWPQMVNGAIWAPLVFLFLFRIRRGIQPMISGMAAGFLLGMAWLTGHHQAPTFLTLAAGGFWIYLLIERWQRIATAAAFGAVFFTTGALQTLPAYEYGKLAKRWIGLPDPVDWAQKVPYMIHSQYSFTPKSLIGILVPDVFDHLDPFLGPVTVAFALLGLMLFAQRWEIRAMAAVAAGGLFLALGKFSILHGILYAWVPIVEKARSPNMAMLLFSFSFSVLCAYGLDGYLMGRFRPRWLLISLGSFAGLLAAVYFGLAIAGKTPDERILVVALLSGLTAAGIAHGVTWTNRAVAVLGITMLILQAGVVVGQKWPSRYWEERTHYLRPMSQHADIADYLKRQRQPLRVDVDGEVVKYNFGDHYGVEQTGGYLASLTTNMTDLETYTPRTQALLDVQYFVGNAPKRPDQTLVFESSSGVKVYKNPVSLPHARFVHRAAAVKSMDAVRGFISNEQNDLSTTAVFENNAPKLAECSAVQRDEVRWIRRFPGRHTLRAGTACRSLLILADTWYPGWKAQVDGRDAEILKAYGSLRGIIVDPGYHTIEIAYRPASVLLGGVLTLLGSIAGLAALWLSRRRPPLEVAV